MQGKHVVKGHKNHFGPVFWSHLVRDGSVTKIMALFIPVSNNHTLTSHQLKALLLFAFR